MLTDEQIKEMSVEETQELITKLKSNLTKETSPTVKFLINGNIPVAEYSYEELYNMYKEYCKEQNISDNLNLTQVEFNRIYNAVVAKHEKLNFTIKNNSRTKVKSSENKGDLVEKTDKNPTKK